MKSKNVIELNGKRYDAVTGEMLGAGSAPTVRNTGNIDGFFRNPRTAATLPAAAVTNTTVITPLVKSSTAKSPQRTHQVASHAKAHRPQSATTLMRSGVKRPAPSLKQQTTVQSSLQHKVPSLIATKRSAYSIDEQRLQRAQSTQRSPHIARHNSAASMHIPVTFAPLHVQPVPVKPEQAKDPTAPAPVPTNKPVDMFEHAIANAGHFIDVKAHRAHFRKQTRRHLASVAAGTLALLVIAGFAVYQNSPGLQLKVASLQAGFSTNMPNFAAAGFAYSGVKAGDGKLTVGFSNDRGRYQLTQQATNWSGDDMIQNVSSTDASGSPDYTTMQVGNVSVYRFNNDDATWVANGKWYTVNGTGALSDTQIKNLVQNV